MNFTLRNYQQKFVDNIVNLYKQWADCIDKLIIPLWGMACPPEPIEVFYFMAYVYVHRRLSDNVVFYVGIGGRAVDKKRAFNTVDRSQYWKSIFNKHGRLVEILIDNISWDEACKKESELILYFGKLCDNTGTLVNFSNGGDGPFGVKRSKETKDKISKAKMNPSQYTRDKISVSRKNMSAENRKIYSDLAKNMPVSQRAKIGASLKKSYTKEMRELAAKKSKENLTPERIKKLAIGRSKIILDLNTGVFYIGSEEAAFFNNINVGTLRCYLRGYRKNKTSLISV